MRNDKTILALIPARGGSKGLPGKNIRPLVGKPLIAWTVEQALRCRAIDRTMVSTDDPSIADVSREYGAEVPFLRPAELAEDTAKTVDVVEHALDWCRTNNQHPDLVMVLQATSPMRADEDITRAVQRIMDPGVRAVVSVCRCEHPPCWTNTLGPAGSMKDFIRVDSLIGRQSLPQYYRLNGAIYLAWTDFFLEQHGFFGDRTYACVMPTDRSLDIDTLLDFEIAEFLLTRHFLKDKHVA